MQANLPVRAAVLPMQAAESRFVQLTEKLDALPSFQADYHAVSPEQRMDIRLIYNKERHYILAWLQLPDAQDKWLVLDYSEIRSEDSGIQLLILSQEDSRRFKVSFREMMSRLDNPLGSALMIATLLPTQNKASEFKLEAGAALLAMGLNAQDLNLSLAITTQKGQLRSSWLDPDTLKTALSVDENAGVLNLTYPEKHRVEIDTLTGLLVSDIWPDPNREGPREIKRIRYEALQENQPFQKLVPKFESLPITNMPLDALQSMFYPLFLLELGRELSATDTLTQRLAQPELSRKKIRAAARALIHQHAWYQISPEQAQSFVDSRIRPDFQQYLKAHPEAKNMSFSAYLDLVRQTSEANPEGLIPPGTAELIQKMQQETQQALSLLPLETRQQLGPLLELGMPEIWSAWVLEALDYCFAQALEKH